MKLSTVDAILDQDTIQKYVIAICSYFWAVLILFYFYFSILFPVLVSMLQRGYDHIDRPIGLQEWWIPSGTGYFYGSITHHKHPEKQHLSKFSQLTIFNSTMTMLGRVQCWSKIVAQSWWEGYKQRKNRQFSLANVKMTQYDLALLAETMRLAVVTLWVEMRRVYQTVWAGEAASWQVTELAH